MQNPDPHILVPEPTSLGLEGSAVESVDPMVVDPPTLELTPPTPESTPVSVPDLADLATVVPPMGGVVASEDETRGKGPVSGELERHTFLTPEGSQSTTPRGGNLGLELNLAHPELWTMEGLYASQHPEVQSLVS